MLRVAFLLMFSTLTSCMVVYQPTVQSVPMFTKKGEAQLLWGFRQGRLSCALTNSFGLNLNAYYRKHEIFTLYDGKFIDPRGNQRLVELTAVHYKAREKGSFEFLWGYGHGYTALSYGGGGGLETIDSHFHAFTIQPNIIRGAGKTKAGFSARLSIIDFYDLRHNQRQGVQPTRAGFLEPAFTLRHKVGPVSVSAQLQLSFSLSDDRDDRLGYSTYRSMTAGSGGLCIHLDELFRRTDDQQSIR